jgi:hypothetical protein
MTLSSAKRAKLGDILEIATPRGYGYCQYTHKHPEMGQLIRVLPGLYEARPNDPSALASLAERYFIFFPVSLAVSRDLVRIVANATIPTHAIPFPLFKSGRPHKWWLWDGEREWRIGELLPDQRKLSVRQVWGPAILASRIADLGGPN